MTEQEKYEWIEGYLAGEMSAEELSRFQARLNTDVAFKKEVALHRQLASSLKGTQVHQLRNVLDDVNKDWKNPEVPGIKPFYKRPFFKLSLIIAAIIMLIFLYQKINPTNQEEVQLQYAGYFEPYTMILNQRSSNDGTTLEAMLNEAISAYETKNFEKSARIFKLFTKENPEVTAYPFYEAVSYLALGNEDEAIVLLNRILTTNDPLYVEQSRWYLALAFLGKDDVESAKRILNEIQKNNYKYQEAQTLLKKME